MNPYVIAICGSDGDDPNLSTTSLDIAYSIGSLIATQGGVVVCGGRSGVMEAVCRGAKKQNGLTIGILPGDNRVEANKCVDIAIPTGLGHRRNFLVVSAGGCIIAIGGRWGTLNEISYAFILNKPVILVKGTGGVVDVLIRTHYMSLSAPHCQIVETAEEAVSAAFKFSSDADLDY